MQDNAIKVGFHEVLAQLRQEGELISASLLPAQLERGALGPTKNIGFKTPVIKPWRKTECEGSASPVPALVRPRAEPYLSPDTTVRLTDRS